MMNTRRNADAIRQLMRSPVWADDGAVKLYLYCLAMASRNRYCWRGLQLQPGDMPLSERKTAEALCWSWDKLRRRMRMLEVRGMVTIQSTPNVGTMLHVVNWLYIEDTDLESRPENGPVWPYDAAKAATWDAQDCIATVFAKAIRCFLKLAIRAWIVWQDKFIKQISGNDKHSAYTRSFMFMEITRKLCRAKLPRSRSEPSAYRIRWAKTVPLPFREKRRVRPSKGHAVLSGIVPTGACRSRTERIRPAWPCCLPRIFFRLSLGA